MSGALAAALRAAAKSGVVLLSQIWLSLCDTGGALCTLCGSTYFAAHRQLRLLRLRLMRAFRKLRHRQEAADFRLPPAETDRWWKALLKEKLPRGWFDAFWYVWMRPWARHLRTTVGLISFFLKAPALMVFATTKMPLLIAAGKFSLLSSGVLSLPVLAPLLLGTGMLLRSITVNASFVLPRIGLTVLLFWCLWFAQGLVQNSVSFLRSQGALDGRLAGGIITTSEIAALVTGVIVLLSMLGVNVSILLMPACVAVAFGAQDIARNFASGLFLFVVQPFRLGDQVAVPIGGGGAAAGGGYSGDTRAWFEGVCEKMDLRYTCLRSGGRRLVVPNIAFMAREFLVTEEPALATAVGPAAVANRLLAGVGGPPSPHYMSNLDLLESARRAARRDDTQAAESGESAARGRPADDLAAEYVLRLLREKPVHAEVKEAALKDGLREIFRIFGEAGGDVQVPGIESGTHVQTAPPARTGGPEGAVHKAPAPSWTPPLRPGVGSQGGF